MLSVIVVVPLTFVGPSRSVSLYERMEAQQCSQVVDPLQKFLSPAKRQASAIRANRQSNYMYNRKVSRRSSASVVSNSLLLFNSALLGQIQVVMISSMSSTSLQIWFEFKAHPNLLYRSRIYSTPHFYITFSFVLPSDWLISFFPVFLYLQDIPTISISDPILLLPVLALTKTAAAPMSFWKFILSILGSTLWFFARIPKIDLQAPNIMIRCEALRAHDQEA